MNSVSQIWQWLISPAVTVGGVPTTWIEILGFISGAVCVGLVAKQNIYNWPIGIVNNFAFLGLFFTYGLYADGLLQLVYVALALYGWWAWLHGGQKRDHLKLSNITGSQWLYLAGAGVVLWAVFWYLLDTYTTSTVGWADALTTTISLLAVWGQARKKIQSWWLWIAADIIYVPLYIYKDLYLTAGLYVVFGTMCVWGLAVWKKQYKLQNNTCKPTTETTTEEEAAKKDVNHV